MVTILADFDFRWGGGGGGGCFCVRVCVGGGGWWAGGGGVCRITHVEKRADDISRSLQR